MNVQSTSVPFINRFVDPAVIPKRRLYSGAQMPAIGLGTFGSDHVAAGAVAAAVEGAAAVGYRHFDCASVYGNEHEIGYALQQVRRQVKRKQLWEDSWLSESGAPTDLRPDGRGGHLPDQPQLAEPAGDWCRWRSRRGDGRVRPAPREVGDRE